MALEDTKLVKKIDKIIADIKSSKSDEEVNSLVKSYLDTAGNESTKIPEFDDNLEWLNCNDSLYFKTQLRGKVCVLDFFTYCCINCMHILPDLESLEQKHSVQDGLVIVGVHSAKFDNEKLSMNILSAIIRYNIEHAVVNDAEAKMWQTLGVACWPTLVVVGPSGEILLSLVGEGHRDILVSFVGAALQYYRSKGQISNHKIGLSLAKDEMPKTSLSFPGKICTDQPGKRLIVSDTGHHRVLVLSKEGVMRHVVGGKANGFKDGTFEEALFQSPQGVVIKDEIIYVADTDNHAIRKIDLVSGMVSTIAGTGLQGDDKEGGSQGQQQRISSPWDIVIGPSPGTKGQDNNESVLYIAMAGTHQIWALYLKDGSWLKGGCQKAGTCIRFAGSGDEANRNNSYPHKSSFAQPSGLTLAYLKSLWTLFVADSESSSIRSIDIATGATKAVVGADRDPNNLFAFGDVDGKGVDVKLQHPLGVAWNKHTRELFVADSYNHKIKIVNPLEKTCISLHGSGRPSPGLLDEPGGLWVSPCGKTVYVADTNNCAIRNIDVTSLLVTQVSVLDVEGHTNSLKKNKEQTDAGHVTQRVAVKRITSARTPVTQHGTVSVTSYEGIVITLNVTMANGSKLNEDAISKWQVSWIETGNDCLQALRDQSCFTPSSGIFNNESLSAEIRVTWPDVALKLVKLQVEAVFYYCEPKGTCRMEGLIYHIPLISGNTQGQHSLVLYHTLYK